MAYFDLPSDHPLTPLLKLVLLHILIGRSTHFPSVNQLLLFRERHRAVDSNFFPVIHSSIKNALALNKALIRNNNKAQAKQQIENIITTELTPYYKKKEPLRLTNMLFDLPIVASTIGTNKTIPEEIKTVFLQYQQQPPVEVCNRSINDCFIELLEEGDISKLDISVLEELIPYAANSNVAIGLTFLKLLADANCLYTYTNTGEVLSTAPFIYFLKNNPTLLRQFFELHPEFEADIPEVCLQKYSSKKRKRPHTDSETDSETESEIESDKNLAASKNKKQKLEEELPPETTDPTQSLEYASPPDPDPDAELRYTLRRT